MHALKESVADEGAACLDFVAGRLWGARAVRHAWVACSRVARRRSGAGMLFRHLFDGGLLPPPTRDTEMAALGLALSWHTTLHGGPPDLWVWLWSVEGGRGIGKQQAPCFMRFEGIRSALRGLFLQSRSRSASAPS